VLTFLLNRGDDPARLTESDLMLNGGDSVATDLALGTESEVRDALDLPSHAARIIRTLKGAQS
jgi:hypothetical protein